MGVKDYKLGAIVQVLCEMQVLIFAAKHYNDFDAIWKDFWDLNFTLKDVVEVDYYDPDTSCEEDIMARYDALRGYLEDQLKIY